ncbi:MAG: hypothetical protein JXQ90_14700 [Cyclobacteriaceae bacterium]
MKIFKEYIVLIFVLGLFVTSNAQTKTQRVSGEHRMRIESYMSVDRATDQALEQARINALADAFGTKVSQSTMTRIETSNTNTNTRFSTLANSMVNGIWLEDLQEPKVEIINEGSDRWLEVSVVGRARYNEKVAVDFEVMSLKCREKGCATQDFKEGETVFLYFNSPVDGYLSVYIDDETNCQMLLPYQNERTNSMKIEADTEYILFSNQHPYSSQISDIDQYQLFTNFESEMNLLYVIFSTEDYYKPRLEDNNAEYKAQNDSRLSDFPKYTDSRSFRKWLNKNLGQNDEMFLEVIDITISK